MHRLLEPIGWPAVGAACIALVLWAWRRHGLGCAAGIAGALIGTYLSLLVLETIFARNDPVDGEGLRRLGPSSYPSGHAAAVAALSLGAVAVRPRHTRSLVVATGAFVATVGVALVVIHAHYPSDVLGGWLLALLWGAGALPSRD